MHEHSSHERHCWPSPASISRRIEGAAPRRSDGDRCRPSFRRRDDHVHDPRTPWRSPSRAAGEGGATAGGAKAAASRAARSAGHTRVAPSRFRRAARVAPSPPGDAARPDCMTRAARDEVARQAGAPRARRRAVGPVTAAGSPAGADDNAKATGTRSCVGATSTKIDDDANPALLPRARERRAEPRRVRSPRSHRSFALLLLSPCSVGVRDSVDRPPTVACRHCLVLSTVHGPRKVHGR